MHAQRGVTADHPTQSARDGARGRKWPGETRDNPSRVSFRSTSATRAGLEKDDLGTRAPECLGSAQSDNAASDNGNPHVIVPDTRWASPGPLTDGWWQSRDNRVTVTRSA